jgi:hypothetical protein
MENSDHASLDIPLGCRVRFKRVPHSAMMGTLKRLRFVRSSVENFWVGHGKEKVLSAFDALCAMKGSSNSILCAARYHSVTRGGEPRLKRRHQGACCRLAQLRESELWKLARKKYSYDLAKAGKAKHTWFNVTEVVKIVLVELSEFHYGHGVQHDADHLLKVVARSCDLVAFVA